MKFSVYSACPKVLGWSNLKHKTQGVKNTLYKKKARHCNCLIEIFKPCGAEKHNLPLRYRVKNMDNLSRVVPLMKTLC